MRAELAEEVAAWVADRTAATVTVTWQFTAAAARTKLDHLYPTLTPAHEP